MDAPEGRLLDHLVGAGKQSWRDFEAERSGGLMVEDQFEFRGLHHRQIGGLGALEDTADIRSCLPPCLRNVGSITHEPADVWKLTVCIDGGHSTANRLVDNVDA